MTRPHCQYRIQFCPAIKKFIPEGMRGSCTVEISLQEVEALRLKNIEGLDQTQAARHMGISQSSFQRLLSSAYKKMSEALIQGKGIDIT